MSNARFSIVPAWIITDSRLKGSDLKVLCLLGSFTNKEGWCRRSQVKMADELGCGRSTVQASLNRLYEIGVVEKREVASVDGRDSAHYYRVIHDRSISDKIMTAWNDCADDEEFGPIEAGAGDTPPATIVAPPATIVAPPATPGMAPPALSSGHLINDTSLTPPFNERERGALDGVKEGGDGQAAEEAQSPASIERSFRKFFFGWKTSISDSEIDARKEWFALPACDRTDAIERSANYQEQALTTGRKYLCSAAKYLRERRWTKLAVPNRAAAGPVPSKPFTRPWCALRLAELLKPMANLPAFPPTVRKMIEDGRLDEAAQQRDRITQHGWPAVNELHARAGNFPPKGSLVPSEIAAIAEGFTGFKVGGAVYEAWRRLHEARQWPFLPNPGKLEYVQFPVIPDGAPDDIDDAVAAALNAFEQSLRGVRGDEHAA